MELSLVFGASAIGVAFAAFLTRQVLSKSSGTSEMQRVSDAIREGAEAFLSRQNRTILYLAVAVAALIFILYGFVRATNEHDPVANPIQLGLWIVLSFLLGAACSVVSGYIGMWVSIRANIRTAAGALKSLNEALVIALRGGAVSGFLVVTLSILGIAGLFAVINAVGATSVEKIPLLIAGFGFGASFVALFAQLGGGIYTKAADVGADLVGKVEAGIPEDDPRNPAVIADLVGDNVGDCAGRGADLFESMSAENIGAMIIASALYASNQALFESAGIGALGVILFPLIVNAFGMIASLVGVLIVKTDEKENPMNALNRGYYVSTALALVGFFVACRWLLGAYWLNFFLCGVVGLATAQIFVYLTQYYTEYAYRPVQSIAKASLTGPATNVIGGIAVGLESAAFPILTISAAIIAAYYLGQTSGLQNAGLFGTAVATLGMLATAAYILAMDNFGPITDNAGGIVEMSEQPESVREKTDKLDAMGNTTKALTKGYAVGSAGLAAFLLFSAYLDELRNYGSPLESVDLSKPEVFIGGMLGAMLVFVFSSFAIRAVGAAAQSVIGEVRRQFSSLKRLANGEIEFAKDFKPDYRSCVDIVTAAALREMVLPGALVVIMPVATGIAFKAIYNLNGGAGAKGSEVVAGLLMVGTIAGILMALFLNNTGGAWDNAKKFVESGNFKDDKGVVHRKKSDAHKAAVVGDTVGDPFKDTAGPSLHVLIKLLSTITLVLAPLFI
ncbi:MAG: sodium-translocating pyrophosphatase [Chloroherpetonaceae bacterium]|nr:sodium-translocating pyrophosphatase [Chloroherpetonaceae bacterium]MDW8438737.1 sodium-translocating pyrophosphatase [Chloroherpetonaceae bacterium]